MAKTIGARRGLVDPLDDGAITALVTGEHGAPFDVLGPRLVSLDGEQMWIVRAFLPGAQAAWVAPLEPPDAIVERPGTPLPDGTTMAVAKREITPPLPMRQLHPAGLFSLVTPAAHLPTYRLDVQRGSGVVERIADPYSFPPLLTEYDLYLIGEGRHLDLYERMGAHLRQVEGVSGVNFAVWAPNAKRMSVVGDFNGWDERAHPMRQQSNGVWELFLPDAQPGALY
ncbi:MAG: hypothetical protein ABI274_15875, partial [Ktedonobacterales bacterium]